MEEASGRPNSTGPASACQPRRWRPSWRRVRRSGAVYGRRWATGAGQRLPAPPAPGLEKQCAHGAGTRAADAERPAHAACPEQPAGGQGSLPKGLAQSPLCRSLQVPNPSVNCFQELLASLLELRVLQTLSLGCNRRQSIPAEIENLRSLECLYLGGNFIKEIPPELANLPSLNYLVLCDNKIQSVPPQLSQ